MYERARDPSVHGDNPDPSTALRARGQLEKQIRSLRQMLL